MGRNRCGSLGSRLLLFGVLASAAYRGHRGNGLHTLCAFNKSCKRGRYRNHIFFVLFCHIRIGYINYLSFVNSRFGTKGAVGCPHSPAEAAKFSLSCFVWGYSSDIQCVPHRSHHRSEVFLSGPWGPLPAACPSIGPGVHPPQSVRKASRRWFSTLIIYRHRKELSPTLFHVANHVVERPFHVFHLIA